MSRLTIKFIVSRSLCQTIGESHSGDMETFVAFWITFHTFKGLLRLW